MQQACRQIRAWQDSLGHPVKVAVNLSARQFHRDALIPMLRQCLTASGIALKPQALPEIWVSDAADLQRAQALLHELQHQPHRHQGSPRQLVSNIDQIGRTFCAYLGQIILRKLRLLL